MNIDDILDEVFSKAGIILPRRQRLYKSDQEERIVNSLRDGKLFKVICHEENVSVDRIRKIAAAYGLSRKPRRRW